MGEFAPSSEGATAMNSDNGLVGCKLCPGYANRFNSLCRKRYIRLRIAFQIRGQKLEKHRTIATQISFV
jgi:hypothetical protein